MDQNIKSIVDKVRQAAEIAETEAVSSQEQSKGIEQISAAVAQMEKVTQSNAASAEAGASTSEQFNLQARSLELAVNELIGIVDGQTRTQGNTATDKPKPPQMTAPRSPRVNPRIAESLR